MKHYQYEVAEKVLDDYTRSSSFRRFQRTYQRLKFALYGLVYIDLGGEQLPLEEALALAWQDVDIAFRGYGDHILTGYVLQLWHVLPKGEEARFKHVIEEAFSVAALLTDSSVPRRYLQKHREAPVRTLATGFNLPAILPISGPAIRDWAADTSTDAAKIEEQLRWYELAERSAKKAAPEEEEEEGNESGCHLHLVGPENE